MNDEAVATTGTEACPYGRGERQHDEIHDEIDNDANPALPTGAGEGVGTRPLAKTNAETTMTDDEMKGGPEQAVRSRRRMQRRQESGRDALKSPNRSHALRPKKRAHPQGRDATTRVAEEPRGGAKMDPAGGRQSRAGLCASYRAHENPTPHSTAGLAYRPSRRRR